MRGPAKLVSIIVLVAGFAAVGACGPVAAPSPAPTVCDGVPGDMGGCDPDRRRFTGSTCQDIAREWAAELDRRVVAILRGPEIADGSARSARLASLLRVVTVDMANRLASLGLLRECDRPEVIAVGEPLFSDELQSGIGGAMYDGDPQSTYRDWLVEVNGVLEVIDGGE